MKIIDGLVVFGADDNCKMKSKYILMQFLIFVIIVVVGSEALSFYLVITIVWAKF